MMGFATLKPEGLIGAGVQMFSHGVMTALFFAAVGMVYDRAHTREIPELGGMVKPLPLVGDWRHHRQPGLDGHARFLRFCGRVPHLYGYLENTMGGGCHCCHFDCRDRIVRFAGCPAGFLWKNAGRV